MGTANQSYAHGDFGLLKDHDGKAYILYNSYDHRAAGQHSNSIDLLTDDYTDSTLVTSGFFAGHEDGDEAQVLMRHADQVSGLQV
jgi:beta-xylosidase